MEGERLHQTLAALAFVGLVELLAVAPGKTLPALDAVASHRIAHRPHATDIKFVAVRAEGHRENAAEVMMAFDDAPACQVGRGPLRELFVAGEFPDANFAHEISRRQVFA